MPQINIGTANITTFGYSVTFDILNRAIRFNLLPFTTGAGLGNTKVAFSVMDSASVVLATIDFTNPQIPNPSADPVYILDLSDSPYAFLFSSFSIVGAIQDQGGQVYSIPPLVKTVCMPNDFQEDGSVPGMFQVIANCSTDNITVKEITLQVYNNLKPVSVSKTGALYYPTGTISPINFTNTPWTNNQVYTGQYRIKNTTYATYNIGNDFYVVVGYVTDQVFDISCTGKMTDLLCCIREVQQSAIKNCDNAIGERARQQLSDITLPFVTGMLAEIRGMDSGSEYALVKKTLTCNCGNGAIGQNEIDPIDPSITTIVLKGVGGTSVDDPVITGNTKTFSIRSSAYQITKGVPSDPGFTIGLDTSVPNVINYPLTLNYLAIAQQAYTATANDPSTLAQLNNLVNALGIDLTGLDGQCIIDLTKITYTAALAVNSGTTVLNVVIGGNTYMAPTGLLANNAPAVQSWLNSLALGAWTATLTSGTLTILSIDNTNIVSTISFGSPNVVLQFGSTTKTLVQIMQAIINYLCSLTSLQISLGAILNVCTIDYNGNVIPTSYSADSTQSDFNQAMADATCNLAARIANSTAVTCTRIQALFQDNPNASFNYATDRFLAIVNGACTSMTAKQAVFGIIAAVNADPQTKQAWCAIDCTVPGSCPDITGINMSIVSGNIGIYGVSFNGPTTSAQTVTVKYRPSGGSFITSTNNLLLFPNGNINGTSPYTIAGLTPGQTYDVQIINNCGGSGTISSITVPSSAVFSTNVLLGTISYLVCGGSPVTVYSNQTFGPTVQIYYDAGLTTPVTGYLFVARVSDGEIFNINNASGIVGADTGSNCSTGTPGSYKLGSAIPAVCSASNQTLYTNGAFAPGKVLYSDVALTHPITGFGYVVNLSTNHIFNLDSSTGIIGSDTASTCTGTATLNMKFVNAGGSFLSFQGSLDRPIDGAVNCSRVFADGFSDSGCTVAVAACQKNSTMSIAPGLTAMSSSPDASPPPTGTWNTAIKSTVFNVIINGTAVVSGNVVTIGSYNVTVIIQACG